MSWLCEAYVRHQSDVTAGVNKWHLCGKHASIFELNALSRVQTHATITPGDGSLVLWSLFTGVNPPGLQLQKFSSLTGGCLSWRGIRRLGCRTSRWNESWAAQSAGDAVRKQCILGDAPDCWSDSRSAPGSCSLPWCETHVTGRFLQKCVFYMKYSRLIVLKERDDNWIIFMTFWFNAFYQFCYC